MWPMKQRYAVLFLVVIALALAGVLVTRILGNPDEVVASGPEAVSSEPKAVTNEPEAVTNEPEVVTNEPEVVTNEPEPVASAPKTVTSPPEADRPGASQGPSTVSDAAPDTTLSLAGGAVTLQYPNQFSLAKAGEDVRASSTIPPCDEGFEYCLYLPQGAYVGTNFRAAGMAVRPRDDLSAPMSCLLAQPPGYESLQPGLVVDQGEPTNASTARFGNLMDGAAGTYATGEVRRLWAAGACYDFTVRVVESQFGNYTPGTIKEFTSEDREAVLDEFFGVLGGLRVRLENAATHGVTWPAAGESDLAPFISLSSPRTGATVSSPLRLAGEAVGPWYAEGSFPVSIVAEDGTVLGHGVVTAQGDWMVTQKVRFEGEVTFEAGSATKATLVLARDNPSALEEQDAALHVPVVLGN